MALHTQFLDQIRNYVRAQDSDNLRSWLQVHPNSSASYYNLQKELKAQRPRDQDLDAVINECLPLDDDAEDGQAVVWPGFQAFMKDYIHFWRNVDFQDLPAAHSLLGSLVNSCNTAFSHPSYGAVMLKTALSLSETLSQLTMTLHKRPELARRLGGSSEGEGRKSIVETSAEIIQKIYTNCLNDRSSDRNSVKGKKEGIYMAANLVLRLLFACRRTHLAKMIFLQLTTNSPPLALYPAAQRVTFLYYLGRFSFSIGHHFLRAAVCLEAAYRQTLPSHVSHRTNILTYLIPANILLGRFPSRELLSRPEAQSLAPIFYPLCAAIRSGDFGLLQSHLKTHESWLFDRGLLLPLTHRLRPLLWRALSRKTFMLTYVPPTDANSRKAATLDLSDLHTVAVYVQRRLEGWTPGTVTNGNAQPGEVTTLTPPPNGPQKLRPNEGMIWGNAMVTPADVEMMVATLIQQGLMHGFIAHGQGRFAIIGAKAKGPVLAGWPNVWQAIQDRRYDGDFDPNDVPGWVRE